jgi:transcriptional regulator with XRE-family HTH domain
MGTTTEVAAKYDPPPWTALDVGLRIKEIRQMLGLSISEVARRGKFERKHVVHLERGRTYPSAVTLRKLAMILQVSTDLILNMPGWDALGPRISSQ